MPIDFPASPSPGDAYSYGGKNYRRMNGYWSAVSQFAPVDESPNTFQFAIKQNWYETLVTSASNPVTNMVGAQLTYL